MVRKQRISFATGNEQNAGKKTKAEVIEAEDEDAGKDNTTVQGERLEYSRHIGVALLHTCAWRDG